MTKQLALRKEVDSLAANLFGNGYMMTVSKWLGCIQELYVLSLPTTVRAMRWTSAITLGAV